MPTLLPIVNEKDEVIGVKAKEACGPDDINRVSGLFLYTPKREVLIAKRVMTKRHDPGKWSYAVAGTVEEGETYLSNILKEAEEEIGLVLTPTDVREVYHGYFKTSHKFFYTQYVAETNLPITAFRRQFDEVDELRYVPADELSRWIEERPEDFVHSMKPITTLIWKALAWDDVIEYQGN